MRNFIHVLLLCVLCLIPYNLHSQSLMQEKWAPNPQLNLKMEDNFSKPKEIPKVTQPVDSASGISKVEIPNRKNLSIRDESWNIGKVFSPFSNSKRTRNSTKAVTNFAGYYIQKDKSYYTPDDLNYSGIAISKNDDGTWKITNFWGIQCEITATINTEAQTISILPQKISDHATYGPIFIYPVNLNNMSYSTTDPISGTIDANGKITLGSWGAFVAEGQYKGRCFDAMTSTELIPANSVITNVTSDGSVQYPALIEQEYDNEIKIINFANNGVSVNASLNSDKTISISPQYIFTNSLYGYFYCYPADWNSGSSHTDGPIMGKGTESSITFGNWGVFCQTQSNLSALKVISTSISTTFPIKYPAELSVEFEGSGTLSSPYLIKTAENLQMLSQSVNKGTNYYGKYFKLMNNIDLANITSRLRPIGNSESNPFSGSFDGNNFAISNLTINTGGEKNIGLFGVLAASGTIKNLTLSNLKVKSASSCAGGLVGLANGKIENCKVDGVLNFTNNIVGGIAGSVSGSIKNCHFDGTITGFGDLGSIAGANNGQIINCSASASLTLDGLIATSNRAIGGIVGSVIAGNRTDCIISDSYFTGSITDKTGYGFCGGIAGEILRGTLARCFNLGTINSPTQTGDTQGSAGGILGFALRANVTDSYNAGTVVCTGSGTWIGGIVGYVLKGVDLGSSDSEETIIKNSYNTAMVTSALLDDNKGIYGITYSPDVFVNCYYDKQMTGLKDGTAAVNTEYLTNATAPNGFETSVWNITEGLYPRLKGIDQNEVAYLSAAPVTLGNDETIRKIKNNFKVSTQNNVTWKIYTNGTFVTSDKALTISGENATLNKAYSREMICGFSSDLKNMKFYSIALVAKLFDGEGTKDSPYLLKTKEDLIALNEATTTYTQPHEGDFFKLANDIDLNYDTNFSGIAADGNSAHCFAGEFDGDNHTIHKLKILSTGFETNGTASTTGAYLYPGFFGMCTKSSVIKNVKIADDCDFTFWGYGGAVVGYTEGLVENCYNYAPIKSVDKYIGGIVGVTTKTTIIRNCYNAGKMLCGLSNVGGITGYNAGLIENCQNDGEIKADFFNALNPKGGQSIAGGIAATNYGTIQNCSNNGYVATYQIVGGIAGGNSTMNNDGSIKNCVNTGLVECYKEEITRGGIVGSLLSKNVVENNYYDAQINICGGANNAKITGITGLSTKEFTNGNKLTNLPENEWSFIAGSYPVLSQFTNEEAASALRSTYVTFADNETRSVVKSEASLSQKTDLTWSLKGNSNFSISDIKLLVSIPTDETVALDTLTATYGKYQKSYPLSAIPDILKGNGTESSPFLIETTDDMTKLASFIEKSKMEYSGNYFKLVNDLDYTGKDYKPISASGSIKFQGYFNGNDKKISNLTYEMTTSTYKNCGLFGSIGESGTLANLTLESGSIKLYSYAAGLVGNLYGTIDNCINKATINTANSGYVGGLVCTAYEGAVIKNSSNHGIIMSKTNYTGGIVSVLKSGAIVDNCFNSGDILPTTDYGAGIAALSNGKIINSYNTGNISGKTYMAGIVASFATGDTIINCYNTATISATSGTVGGIVATSATKISGLIDGCYNTGELTGKGNIGGIAGKIQAGITVSNCYNTGNINSAGSNSGGVLGGLSGNTGYTTSLLNSYNTGDVTSSSGTYVGGVVGNISSNTYTENCYNLGEIIAASNFNGGFAGGCSGIIKDCWNAGNLTSSGYGLGGISGIGSGNAINCFNLGDITCTVGAGSSTRFSNVGGIWGYGTCEFTNCYNMGTLTAPDRIGGISGVVLLDSLTMTNCYNGGKIVSTVANPVKIGNIIMPYDAGIKLITKNVYFDTTVNTFTAPVDSVGKGLTTEELTKATLGNEYVYAEATYPVLKDFSDNIIPNFYAATFILDSKDTSIDVKNPIKIGYPEGITWTSTEHFSIDAGKATPIKKGEATLTRTAGNLSKTYKFTVTGISGVDGNTYSKTCISKTYYTIDGIIVPNPVPGIYIVKSIYDDGSKKVEKLVVR